MNCEDEAALSSGSESRPVVDREVIEEQMSIMKMNQFSLIFCVFK